MSLEITREEREGIQILTLHGQLTFGQEDLILRQELDRLIEAAQIRVAFDLGGLSKLDAAGVGTLLFAREKLRKEGGNLALFNLNPSHIELLAEAQLETAVDVFPTQEDAIDSFFPDREIKPYDILKFVESMEQKRREP